MCISCNQSTLIVAGKLVLESKLSAAGEYDSVFQ